MTTENDLMQLLIDELNAVEELQPGDVTKYALAEKSGRKLAMVEKILRNKVEAGELVVVKKFDSKIGRNVNVYVAPNMLQ
jgi:ribosomal protein S25